ncbi:hypothetical protein [Methylobacterium sp. Leaf118]|uniref:hypothetical protein n=1 Tax=Methylobacterium sp. Leaf118 TaxID=2876562 RepID=UPI001E3F03E4|nr:hypothetical protein [Methylobacterium sp. Leaf118]
MARGARRAALAGLLLWIGLGFGCEPGPEAGRQTLCRRAVPALRPSPLPAGTVIRLLRVGPGSGRGSVRVDYQLAEADGTLLRGEAGRVRFLVCGFDAGTDLTGLATERGPVNGASLYLLKRYYLDTPEAEAADPGRSGR